MADPGPIPHQGRIRSTWIWIVLALAIIPAVWHVVDFPDDIDPEFPTVERPTFNKLPPPAYRLAEPGDTIDRISLYVGAVACVLAAIRLIRSRGDVGFWPAALALAAAGLWHASTPGPTFDGWHGLGWRVISDSAAPLGLRIALAGAALALTSVVVVNAVAFRGRWGDLWRRVGELKVRGLLIVSALLVIARQFEIPGVEPVGYWPRWSFAWGMLAFALVLFHILLAQGMFRLRGRVTWTLIGVSSSAGLAALGICVSWYHRPLERLRTVEPGRIYISAMPTYAGLKVAQERHHFKTIINIFPEDLLSQRSPRLPDEHRFVREHGIRYIEASGSDNDSDELVDLTLKLARDPEAWPILLHCHGCMDRSPGWMGIYRFVVQGRPLLEILKEIEAHRGYRPKASITLLFNRALEPRAPERYRADPLALKLQEYAHGNAVIRPKRPGLTKVGESPARR
jgi:hypothetical protein